MKIIQAGYIFHSYLKKAAIVIDDKQIMFSGATVYSNPVALIEKGRLVKIKKCKRVWCKISSENFKGWLKKEILWGLL